MTLGRKTGGKDIKKGQVLNPHGRPKLPEDLKKARAMNRIEFAKLLNEYLVKNGDQINQILKAKETTALQMIVARIIQNAVKQGDHKRLDFLLDRLIGKVKEEKEVDLNLSGKMKITNDMDFSKLSDDELTKVEELLNKC